MPAAFGDLGAGASLGRYELLLPVAQGGMAEVWAARLKGTRGFSKTVAVKTMLPALSADPRFESMFLAEAEIAARIKHPNVCEILDLGEERGLLYLVIEWIDGDSLVTFAQECEARGRPIPPEVAARFALDAARGLHAAHELKDDEGALVGVVHRDVSPHNILVTQGGVVKIVDFGVAKAMSRTDHHVTTNAGHLKGKAPYMAPEQVYGEDIDRRVDIFALGIVLYQLTTGTHPFRADNELATLARITMPEPVPSPGTLVPGYPAELARVVDRALEKDRDARYPTMAAFAHDLEVALASLTAAGHAESAEAFAGEILGPRAQARAAALKAAARTADENAGRSLSGVHVRPREADDVTTGAPISTRARARVSAAPTRRGRGVAVAAALAGVGLGVAIAGVFWAGRGAPRATGAEGALVVTAASPSPGAPPSAAATADAASATATAAAPPPPPPAVATPTPVPAASTSAAVPPAALPKPRPAAAPSKAGSPNSSLRTPGF